jgi:ABC-type uncharacterized transport system permease subunit
MTSTQTSTFQPTFLQKLLGRNYKWWYVLKYQFQSRSVSIFDNFLFVVGQILILFSSLAVWWLANNKIIDAGLQEKWTYFVVGELFFNFIFNFAEFEGFDILRGSTSIDLLKPQNYFVLKLFSSYGEALVQNIIKGFLLIFTLVVLIFTKNISTFNPVNFGLFLLLVPAGLLILYFIEMIVGFSAFFLRQINGVILNFSFLLGILMGRVFPLDLLIPSFTINFFNPFAYLFFHPMQIYLGKYNSTETLLVFLGGIAWCVVLYFLASFVFKMGLKRNESVGL